MKFNKRLPCAAVLVALCACSSVASAAIVTPSQFHATITGFTTYADADFTLPNAGGVTIGSGVFATVTPTTVEVGLTPQGFSNFSQVFEWSFTGFQLPAGQVISGLTVLSNGRSCCSTSTSFTDNSIQIDFNGEDTRGKSDTISYTIDFTPADTAVPEPAPAILLTCGLLLLLAVRRQCRC